MNYISKKNFRQSEVKFMIVNYEMTVKGIGSVKWGLNKKKK